MRQRLNLYTLLILFIFAVVHLLLYYTSGIFSSLEAEKYVRQADYMLAGSFPSASKYYFYLPIIFLIAFAKKFALGYGFVVIIQSIFSLSALLLFYFGLKKLLDKKVALYASIMLCFFLPFIHWNFYLYSESLFISLSMILFYAVCRFENQNKKNFLLIILTLTVMLFTRPFGALFVPPLLIYFLFSIYKNKKFKRLAIFTISAYILLMLLSIQAVFQGGEDMDAMKPFIEEHIVCFVPQKPEGATLNLKYYNNGIRDILYYIFHNPLHFGQLMAKRLYSFFKFSRPWYSASHNLFLLCFMLPVYFFFFYGLIPFLKKYRNLGIYVAALLILYPLATTFQCDDWHSRFTFPILPPIFAIAAFGFHLLLAKWKRNTSQMA